MGLLNYYRRCIPKTADIVEPLNELLKGLSPKKKNETVIWSAAEDMAFTKSKKAIAEAATTTFLKADAPLALRADASDLAIGAVLEQQDDQGRWKPLAFFSKNFPIQSGAIVPTIVSSWPSLQGSRTCRGFSRAEASFFFIP